MTREEAIANLNMISVAFVEPVTKEQRKLINDTFEMAIQALSQIDEIRELIKGAYEGKLYLEFTAWCLLNKLEDIVGKREKKEPCDDAISREAVLNAISRIGLCKCSTNEVQAVDECLRAVEALPPVTQKSGKWIDYRDDGFVECPFCGHATNCEDDIDELHYCFYCGAKMVEPQERSDKE